MADTNSFARTLHDVGLAAWFGGSLMGAVGLNGAAATADKPDERTKIANAGWAKWTPVNLAAIAVHSVGGLQLIAANKGRISSQAGVGQATTLKTALTLGAMGATAYSRVLGQKIMEADRVPAAGVTEPSAATPPDVASAQKQLKYMQWAIPALTAAVLVVNARMGEQQRPAEVTKGLLDRLNPAA